MLTLHTLASGSSGNAMLVSDGRTHILLDAGISARRIGRGLAQLGLRPGELAGVLITHEHSDHIAGLTTLLKNCPLPVWATRGTCGELRRRIPFVDGLVHAAPAEGFGLGSFWVRPFPTSHDAAESAGFRLTADGGETAAVATDLGVVTGAVLDGVLGADILVAETNHDEEWLRSGPYPYYLKQRVLGDRGHLSNEAGAELVAAAVEAGAREVVLAHLSAENDTPARARQAVCRRLAAAGIAPEADVRLTVAPRDRLGEPHTVGRRAG